jgi:hypothetical protein
MRRLLTGFVVAAMAAVVPALALAGNQEIADQIAGKLRHSKRMSDYRISVKFQDGTAWLRGRVANERQIDTTLQLVFEVPAVNRVVNDLTVAQSKKSAVADRTTEQMEQRRLAKRMEAAFKHGLDREIAPTKANYAAESRASEVKPTSAEEPQELPRLSFQRSQPMAREEMRMAMAQPGGAMPTAGPNGGPLPMYTAAASHAAAAPARYDQPCLPNYAWPSYAAYPNYASVTYPRQYSPTAWPYIGPFYPYPQVPLGWRKVTMEWKDGWWFLDFKDQPASAWHR